MKEKSPNFKYLYSHILEQEIAVHKETGWLYCSDGTKYSPREIELIKFKGGQIFMALHLLKKTFDGEITAVEIEKAKETQEKQVTKEPEQKPTVQQSQPKQEELDLF